MGIAVRHADHVVDLDLAAGAHAEIAVDAGVQVDRHRRVAEIRAAARARETATRAPPSGPPTARAWSRDDARPRARAGRRAAAPSPCARGSRALRGGHHLHAARRASGCRTPPAPARPRSRPCRRGSCHRRDSRARAASTDAGSGALALRHLPDGLAGPRLDLAAVERERDGIGHDGNLNRICHCRANTPRTTRNQEAHHPLEQTNVALTLILAHFLQRSPISSRSFLNLAFVVGDLLGRGARLVVGHVARPQSVVQLTQHQRHWLFSEYAARWRDQRSRPSRSGWPSR